MKWRPEGWENPMDDGRPSTVINDMRRRAFEAGADAMLEGLKKQDDYVKGFYYGKGKWVFIPEEE